MNTGLNLVFCLPSTKLRRSGCSSTCSQGKFGESQVRLVVYRAERISESCLTMISEQSGSSDVSVRRPNVPGGSGKPFGRGRRGFPTALSADVVAGLDAFGIPGLAAATGLA